MSEIKTKVNDANVTDFINAVPDETKKKDSLALLNMFTSITGESAKMWGTSIIGFGQYHYKSERSSQEGDWPLVGFSPRKQSLTLYISHDLATYSELFEKLGKHKLSVGCVYINKLTDVDTDVLKKLIETSYKDAKRELVDSKA
jgi:hypothetical protein